MRVILSPAKKMNANEPRVGFGQDIFPGMPMTRPEFLERTEIIKSWLAEKSFDELKKLWACNDDIVNQNIERLETMNLEAALTPAVLAYEGIAFTYMAPSVFEDGQYEYIQEHLRILSAFYGVLKGMDGVTPYRLEMQAKASIDGYKNLYDFWGRSLYESVRDQSGIIINLASKEYSRCIEKYLTGEDRYITCNFMEEAKGRLVTKATYAKMARGEMVRFMAENKITDPNQIKDFNRLGYTYQKNLSTETEYFFLRNVTSNL